MLFYDGREELWADPYAICYEKAPGNASMLTEFSYEYHDDEFVKARKKNKESLNIYEIHMSTFMRNEDGSVPGYAEFAGLACDHVADMVELYLRMGNMNSEGKQEKLLLEMMEEAKDMIHNSVEAFVEGDEANAQKVVEHDDVVDDLFNDMKKEMMQAIREQNLDADRVVDYLMMAKYLEKVGDHAVNIAQWAIFRMTGDMEGVKLY